MVEAIPGPTVGEKKEEAFRALGFEGMGVFVAFIPGSDRVSAIRRFNQLRSRSKRRKRVAAFPTALKKKKTEKHSRRAED